jgi:hypothetical protein
VVGFFPTKPEVGVPEAECFWEKKIKGKDRTKQ